MAHDDALLAKTQRDAMDATPWDAVYISPKAGAWFTGLGLDIPQKGTLAADSPATSTMQAGGKTIGLIFIPPSAAGLPSDEEIDAVVEAGRELQGRADLVIALSPWGMRAELDTAPRLEGVVQLLLGAGQGMGLPPQIIHAAPSILWCRAESQGRSLMAIEILQFPTPGSPTPWMEAVNFAWQEITLSTALPEDPTIREIVSVFEVDPE